MKRPGEMDLTLVAFYGRKPRPVEQLLNILQGALRSHLGASFSAYSMDQVHATIIGLEGRRDGTEVLNTNAGQVFGYPWIMDLRGLFLFFRKISPLRVRIGGFVQSKVYPFTSRGLHPYVRSFSLHGPIAVAMGWPVTAAACPFVLDSLRRECTRYNVLHKYHQKASDIDNDFFFVLGRVECEAASKENTELVERTIRQLLSEREPVDIVVGPDELSVVAYVDTELPVKSSVQYSLTEALTNLAELKLLYREKPA